MATAALTGSAGWSAAHPLQLGAPPLQGFWARPLPKAAVPLIAHVYSNDGVTSKGTFQILNRPGIKATTANGGFDQITLEVATQSTAAIWGQFTWGTVPWGGKVAQGDVLRLSEDGGPWPGFIYGGVVESLPDTRSATGTKHEVVVTPFAAELTRVASNQLYSVGTDIALAVREAVALTQHCHCDQVSVPFQTGIPLLSTSGATADFRGQKVNQVLDTCRSLAGPQWFWFCDEMGRVWFQPQGSGAVYTLLGGQHYEERVSNGGDIQDRINQVPAVGGVPTGGGANVQAVYNGSSQSTIGIRTLDPPISYPGITDQATIQALANGIGATLDQTWTRVSWKVLPPTGQPNEVHPGRIHQSQPGGGMVRYFEETKNPLTESGQGSGYAGPFICQSVEYDGLYQQVEAGNIPVTSTTDIQNMVQRWAQRAAAIQLINTAASLNLTQTLTGSFQSGTGTLVNGQPATLWSLGQQMFQAIDPNGVARWQQGNLPVNGLSPAQWGARANLGDGSPLWDSTLGFIAVLAVLGSSFVSASFTTSSTTPVLITSSGVTFTPAHQTRAFAFYGGSVAYSGQTAFIDMFLDGTSQTAGGNGPGLQLQFPTTTSGAATSTGFWTGVLTGNVSHTFDLRASQSGVNSLTVEQCALLVIQLGVN